MKMLMRCIGCFAKMLNVFQKILNNCTSDFWLLKKLIKIKTSRLAPIAAVSFLAAFSADKKIQADSGTSRFMKTIILLQKKTPALRLVFEYGY